MSASSSSSSSSEAIDLCLKFILVGDSGVGKTCFLRQFLEQKFAVDQTHTIGVEFGAKVVKVAGRTIKLQIWDTAGQERYRAVTKSYYRGASGALIFYDVTSRDSFKHLPQWLEDARRLAGDDVVICCIGNKSDCASEDRVISMLEASQFAQENELLFFESSALTGDNVEAAFLKLTKSIIYRLESSMEARGTDRKSVV